MALTAHSPVLPPIDVRQREEQLFHVMDAGAIDSLYVPDLTNVRWLTGFSGSSASVVVNGLSREIHLMTDSRYRDQSREQLSGCGSSAIVHMARSHRERGEVIAGVVGDRSMSIDPSEVTVAFHRELTGRVRDCTLLESTPFTELRRVKDEAELARIRRAASVADEAIQEVVSLGLCGLTEREIRLRLEHEMARRGADAPSFDTIVATGPNAAMPHHSPTDAVVQPGHMVIIDMGALVEGYHSDMTRTVRVGELTKEDEHLFQLVRSAQEAGIRAVAEGERGSRIDAACRTVFEEAGVADLYVHGTGHGVGLVIHEEPFFHRDSDQRLLDGEVVTVEPGLYRVGVSGVRIEDLVVVTGSGCQVLSTTPKELSCPPSPRTI